MAYQARHLEQTAPLVLQDRADSINADTFQYSPDESPSEQEQRPSLAASQRYIGHTMKDETPYGHPKKVYTRQERVLNHGLDVLLLLSTLPFYAFAIISLIINREVVNDNTWSAIQKFNYVIVTAFPIVFAIIGSRAVRHVAAWRLEHGTRLGSLEQLTGSVSVGGTMTTQYSLRIFNLLSVVLVLLWANSPLGGQASLHVITTQLEPIYSMMPLQYFSTEQSTPFRAEEFEPQTADILYKAALLSSQSIRSSSRDIWANVKIPDLSLLPAKFSSSTESWTNISASDVIEYSSLVGIPVFNLTSDGNTTFALETSYFSVDCHNVTWGAFINAETVIDTDPDPNKFYMFNATGTYASGSTRSFQDSFTIASNNLTAETDNNPENISQTLIFQSGSGSWDDDNSVYQSSSVTRAFCTLTTTYVESQAFCNGLLCNITAMRPSQLNRTLNDTSLANIGTFSTFTSNLQAQTFDFLSIDFEDNSGMTPTEYYIYSPNYLVDNSTAELWRNLSTVSPHDFGIRLQQIINTFWQGSMDPGRIFGDPNVYNTYELDPSFQGFGASRSTVGTNATWKNVYTCHTVWVVLYLVATTIMLLIAVVGAVTAFFLRGPDILGFASNLTRDSLHIEELQGDSALGGSDRAKKFWNTRVRMADVDSNKELGYISIVDDRKTTAGAIRKNRFYR